MKVASLFPPTITNIFVHTPGTNYVPNTLMQIETGDFNARFTIDVVYGPINPGSINIVNPGSKYQSGDVLAIGNPSTAVFSLIVSPESLKITVALIESCSILS